MEAFQPENSSVQPGSGPVQKVFCQGDLGTRQGQFRDPTTCNPILSYKRGWVVIRVRRDEAYAIVSAIV